MVNAKLNEKESRDDQEEWNVGIKIGRKLFEIPFLFSAFLTLWNFEYEQKFSCTSSIRTALEPNASLLQAINLAMFEISSLLYLLGCTLYTCVCQK